MALYLISYDLMKQPTTEDYKKLTNALETGLNAKRVLLSQWVCNRVNTNASSLRDYIRPYLDSNDRLLVVQFDDWASFNALVDINKM